MCDFELTPTEIYFKGKTIECIWAYDQLCDMEHGRSLVTYQAALVKIWVAISDAGLNITDEEEQYIRDYTKRYFFKL